MEQVLTDILCTRCGLCCDGSLFADVELSGRAEATRVEAMGLEIDEDSDRPLLVLPCGALRGTRCGIYAHRPRCCRTFECRLLQDVRRGTVAVEQALDLIADARAKIGRVQALLPKAGEQGRLPLGERVAEVLAVEADANPETERRHAELEAAMSDVEEAIRRSFLGAGRAARVRGSI
jgi:hypothetical protein